MGHKTHIFYTSYSLSSYIMGVFLYTRHTWCIHTPHAHCQAITWVSSYTPDTHGVSYTSCSLSSYTMGVFFYTRHTWCIINLMLTVEL
uniref:Uncharacterized protein n=1 Tax=Ciona intestinalis TaxID=7719 RepID=H2XQF2_CIOIN